MRRGARKRDATSAAESIVSAIRKRLGPKSQTTVQLVSAGTTASEVNEWIHSGFGDVDRILGGGWAVGRCSEVFGDEACGKSALAHVAIREVQRMDGLALLLDFEHALDKKRIKNVGIDMDKLVYATPESMEEGWEILWAFLKHVRQLRREGKLNGPVLVVWDSIAGSIPKAEIEGTMDQQSVGLHARLMSKGCRKATREVSRSRAHLMWINQYRAKIGGSAAWGGPDKDTTGGKAAKFYASQRVSCVRIKRIKPSAEAGTPPSGYLIKVETEKCRLAPPHRRSEWVLDFTEGPSVPLTARHLLQEAKIIRAKRGAVTAPWLDKGDTFKFRRWSQLWAEEKPFRVGAKRALAGLVAAGGVHTYLATRSKKDDEADEDEGDD